MAIKSRHRGRSRAAKHVTRGPKFQPKAAPTPWYRSRRFQVIGAFIAGVALVLLVTWIRDGLRAGSAEREADEQAAALRRATQQFSNLIDPIVSEVGVVTGPTIDPFPRLPQDLEAFAQGRASADGVAASAEATADVTGEQIPKMREIDVASIFGDKGLSAADVTLAVHARDRMLHALQVYDEAAAQALRASAATGREAEDLAASALALTEAARAEFVGGYTDHVELQQAAGTFRPPTVPQQGLPPGAVPSIPGA